MSELKEHQFCRYDEIVHEYSGDFPNDLRLYYLKSEADKVIAEQNERYFELQDTAIKIDEELTETKKQLHYNKYNRCFAMAKWCEERYKYLTCLENWQLTDKEYQQVIGDYWDRWYKRWLELAQIFKERKNAED